jgi:hypothetical protein
LPSGGQCTICLALWCQQTASRNSLPSSTSSTTHRTRCRAALQPWGKLGLPWMLHNNNTYVRAIKQTMVGTCGCVSCMCFSSMPVLINARLMV